MRFSSSAIAIRTIALGLLGPPALFGSVVATSGCRSGRFNNMISKSQEIDLGQEGSAEVEKQNKLVTAGPDYDRLRRVADRIIPLARRDYDVPYTVKLIDSKEVNAFAMPGGPIYFYDGLMKMAQSDDEVAAVLGHEATHIVRRHTVKQISDVQTKSTIAEILLGGSPGLAQSAAGLLLQIQQLSFSREDEAEADDYGFDYLTEAGYDPEAMASMFKRLEAKEGSGGGGPEWLQNHPLTRKRIETAEQRAADYQREHGLTP